MLPIIKQEAKVVHPLFRFVTPETVALLLEVPVEQLKEIRCWDSMILVVGHGISKFISYADLPPIVEVEPPTKRDFIRWLKRWKKRQTKQAPEFWVEFYAQKFQQASCVAELSAWGQLVGIIKSGLSQAAVEWLENLYSMEKFVLGNW